MDLIYGFDPLCGWCYGLVPAMRRLRAERPDISVRLAMAGLVTGARAGPYAEAEPYIRGASRRLAEVTGRAPSQAFFDLIATPGVRGDSGPPSVAIDVVRRRAPGVAVEFAHAVIEAHFERGADLNRPETYAPLLAGLGLDPALPDLADPALAEAAWAEGRAMGLSSYPTLILRRGDASEVLPTTYEPAALLRLLGDRLGSPAPAVGS